MRKLNVQKYLVVLAQGAAIALSSTSQAGFFNHHRKDQEPKTPPCARERIEKCFKEAREQQLSCNELAMRVNNGYFLLNCSNSAQIALKSCGMLEVTCAQMGQGN